VPGFLKMMHKAVLDYPQYLKERGGTLLHFEPVPL